MIAAAVVLTAGASGCSSGRDALTIYSGRSEELIDPLLEQFSEDTGVPIDIRYGDSADLALLIEEEGDNSPADVFLSQTPGAVGYLGAQGRLAQLDTSELAAVDERFEAADGTWVGLSARQRVLVYNREMIDEAALPTSVLDLTDSRWEGMVALAPTNGSFQDFVTALRALEGEGVAREWLEGMVANQSPTYADNSSIVAAVARGEVPMGLVNHYYNYRQLEAEPDSPSRNYVFPDGDVGSLLIASTASIIDGTDARDRAHEFIDYLLSENAQEFYSKETFEYPLAEGAETSTELPPLDTLESPQLDLDRLGGGLKETIDLIRDSGLL
ncbi:MAG: iron ABC transporter substrate-binding protein [Actinomycetota bacterium]